jgi:hypothetical protein
MILERHWANSRKVQNVDEARDWDGPAKYLGGSDGVGVRIGLGDGLKRVCRMV